MKAARRLWSRLDPRDIKRSWNDLKQPFYDLYESLQVEAASTVLDAQADILASNADYVPTYNIVNPSSFKGYAASGLALDDYMSTPIYQALSKISDGMQATDALKMMSIRMENLAGTGLADTARQAAGVDTTTRQNMGYIRMAYGSACSRCMILAGTWYRWNQGFARHPHCYCRHIPCTKPASAGLHTDPMEIFNSMSEAEQDKKFGKVSAQAIRDGADIYQVVNAHAGMSYIGHGGSGHWASRYVREGAGKRRNKSYYRQLFGETAPKRLTPEEIYRQARSRREAIELLRKNAYILPDDFRESTRLVNGSRWYRNSNFGEFGREAAGGQTGRGGTSSPAQAYRQALKQGYRDHGELATMTAAERRLFEARLRYVEALSGHDMKEMAAAENYYRHMLANKGNIYPQK